MRNALDDAENGIVKPVGCVCVRVSVPKFHEKKIIGGEQAIFSGMSCEVDTFIFGKSWDPK